MAANDDLPRGVTVTGQAQNGGGAAVVTFPAMFGLAWVLTNVEAMVATFGTFSGAYTPQLLINGVSWAILAVGSLGVRDDWTLGGNGIAFPTQTAVTLTFNAGTIANTFQVIVATAKPVRSL